MIVFDDNLIAIWHVYIPHSPQFGQAESDFMAALSRLPAGGFRLVYRFRYYKDARAFGSKDYKHWYSGTIQHETEADVITKMRHTTAVLHEVGGGPLHEMLRGDMTTDEFLAAFQKLPFVHVRAEYVGPAGHA